MDRIVIGVSGGSGSGKSVFINDLKSKFADHEVALISQDNYYKPREMQKKDGQGVRNFDLPYSIELEEFERDLRQLIKGESVTRREYCYNNALATPQLITVAPAPVILAEGLFLFHHSPTWELLNLRIFLQASGSQMLSRRIIRDQTERNYPLEDVLYRFEHHVSPAFKQFIEPYQNQVDIIINNYSNYRAGLNVLEGYIRHILFKYQYPKG